MRPPAESQAREEQMQSSRGLRHPQLAAHHHQEEEDEEEEEEEEEEDFDDPMSNPSEMMIDWVGKATAAQIHALADHYYLRIRPNWLFDAALSNSALLESALPGGAAEGVHDCHNVNGKGSSNCKSVSATKSLPSLHWHNKEDSAERIGTTDSPKSLGDRKCGGMTMTVTGGTASSVPQPMPSSESSYWIDIALEKEPEHADQSQRWKARSPYTLCQLSMEDVGARSAMGNEVSFSASGADEKKGALSASDAPMRQWDDSSADVATTSSMPRTYLQSRARRRAALPLKLKIEVPSNKPHQAINNLMLETLEEEEAPVSAAAASAQPASAASPLPTPSSSAASPLILSPRSATSGCGLDLLSHNCNRRPSLSLTASPPSLSSPCGAGSPSFFSYAPTPSLRGAVSPSAHPMLPRQTSYMLTQTPSNAVQTTTPSKLKSRSVARSWSFSHLLVTTAPFWRQLAVLTVRYYRAERRYPWTLIILLGQTFALAFLRGISSLSVDHTVDNASDFVATLSIDITFFYWIVNGQVFRYHRSLAMVCDDVVVGRYSLLAVTLVECLVQMGLVFLIAVVYSIMYPMIGFNNDQSSYLQFVLILWGWEGW